mmetsp:Transcript_30042/g.34071  ORF Transcript_30042/g.34071 Transcript_30042/m.34071 type:complete len:83 (-) Transcript_30042:323-571(-)
MFNDPGHKIHGKKVNVMHAPNRHRGREKIQQIGNTGRFDVGEPSRLFHEGFSDHIQRLAQNHPSPSYQRNRSHCDEYYCSFL